MTLPIPSVSVALISPNSSFWPPCKVCSSSPIQQSSSQPGPVIDSKMGLWPRCASKSDPWGYLTGLKRKTGLFSLEIVVNLVLAGIILDNKGKKKHSYYWRSLRDEDGNLMTYYVPWIWHCLSQIYPGFSEVYAFKFPFDRN